VAERQGDLADTQAAIDAARAQASVGGLRIRAEVRRGRVPEALREALQAAGADLMLLGRRDGGGHAWAGGTAQKAVGLVECPVWVRGYESRVERIADQQRRPDYSFSSSKLCRSSTPAARHHRAGVKSPSQAQPPPGA
jgi:hypothetical protein